VDNAPITGTSFEFVLTNSDDVKFTVTGRLLSNNEASGTLAIEGETFCGETDVEMTWTAKHISSPDDEAEITPTAEATEEPTDEPTAVATLTPTAEPTSAGPGAADVVNSVFNALEKKDITTALAAFSDDVVYTVGGTSGVGKASLQSYMQLAMAFGSTFKVSNLQDLGGIVTFTVTVTGTGAGTYSNSSAIVQDGKIEIFTIQ
jgi:hypothetical protein